MSCLRRIFMLLFVIALPTAKIFASDPTITRDTFGVPTISGGDLAEACQAIGRVHAEDRLWQIFLQNIVANGRAAQYLGISNPLVLASDVFQREINPTDEEVQREIDVFFTKNTALIFSNYVKGLNDRVDEVNNNPALLPFEFLAIGFNPPTVPIPHFTLFDTLRSVRFFLQSFSPTQVPMFQLNNLVALETLAAIFGPTAGFAIFEDVDPTSSQVRSKITIMPNNNATPPSITDTSSSSSKAFGGILKVVGNQKALPDYAAPGPIDPTISTAIQQIAQDLTDVRDWHKTLTPSLGSNGQAVGPRKSASGNTLLRCAIQSNFNFPSDFYQVKVDNSTYSGNYFIVPGLPMGVGTYNDTFGFTVQTGTLPTNDFLIEPITNISSSRTEVIKIKGHPDLVITVSRSSSGGWVIQNPVSNTMPTQMLTLRSIYIERQLQGFNAFGELPFVHNVPEFFKKALKFSRVSDLLGFEGECADSEGNIGAFQATAWTQLPALFDRRLPQGVLFSAPTNEVYSLDEAARKPMMDINNPQGFYSGWNNLFKQFVESSADTTTGIALSRAYWLIDYLNSFSKISFDDLKQTTFRQAVANSIVAFKDDRPTAYADLFTPLFKELFFEVIENQAHPTADQLTALALLSDFEGNWFDGNEAQVIATNDVSDKFILASAWLLNVAANILNPFIGSTSFEVDPGSFGNPLPTFNAFNVSNNLATYQGNLLARILGTSTDNSLIFPGWLASVNVNQVIIDSLDQAIANLGGFGARPWGAGLRPTYLFKSPIFGPLVPMKIFNSSSLYFVTEFGPKGIVRMESVLPLGESGEVLIAPGPSPVFTPHNFDQFPFFQTFQLIPN